MGSAATDAIVQLAEVRPGMRVLDVGTGTGEPAISLAPRVAPGGEVVGIDMAVEPLDTAHARAAERQLTNITFREADVHALPFDEATFDVITSRLAVMFFADAARAFEEMRRVLKPGGRVALLAWGPMDQQPYFSVIIGAVLSELPGASVPAEALKVFKFGEAGSLSATLRRASFRDVREELRPVPWVWPGPPEELWEYFQAATVPFHPLLASMPPDRRKNVGVAAIEAINRHYDGKQVNFEARFVLASAVR
jgi:ubiquinone/menaquinone biosynthesis C-methylase UbiE